MTDLDIIKECRQTGRTRTTTKNLLQKAYHEQMTEKEQLKVQIQELQEQLQKLEEKSPAEKAYYAVYGWYPPTTSSVSNYEDNRWRDFQNGYNASKVNETPQEPEDDEWTIDKLQEKNWYVDAKTNLKSNWEPKSKEPEENEWKSVALRFGEKLSGYLSDGYYELSPAAWFRWAVFTYGKTQQVKDAVRESVKWCEEHPNESVEDYLTPHTPKPMNEVLDRLENKYENDDVVNRMLKKWEENPPDFLRFELSRSLEDRIYKWWETCFVHHTEWSMEECVEDLLDIITLFLPGEQNSEGTQNIDTVVAVEAHNELLRKIKSKLRNKKDT